MRERSGQATRRDTYSGTATGRCNGAPGATVDFTFVDAGDPGTSDSVTIEITGCPDTGEVSVSGNLDTGNHRAHTDYHKKRNC